MFWSDTLNDITQYCSCHGRWTAFQIVSGHVNRNVLEVFMTPEFGKRCLVYRLKRGCDDSPCETIFNTTPWEHVKIEVVGGEITLVGTSDNEDQQRCSATQKYSEICVFYNFKDDEVELIQNLTGSERQIALLENNSNSKAVLVELTHKIIPNLNTLRLKVLSSGDDSDREREEFFLNNLSRVFVEKMLEYNKTKSWNLKLDFFSTNNADERMKSIKILDHLVRVLIDDDFNRDFTMDDTNTFTHILKNIDKQLENEIKLVRQNV